MRLAEQATVSNSGCLQTLCAGATPRLATPRLAQKDALTLRPLLKQAHSMQDLRKKHTNHNNGIGRSSSDGAPVMIEMPPANVRDRGGSFDSGEENVDMELGGGERAKRVCFVENEHSLDESVQIIEKTDRQTDTQTHRQKYFRRLHPTSTKPLFYSPFSHLLRSAQRGKSCD